MVWVVLTAAACAAAAQGGPAVEGARERPVAARVAILEIGAREGARGSGEHLGMDVRADVLREAAALLEQEGVTTVVFRLDLSCGPMEEAFGVQEVLTREYLPRFRCVVWCERAVSEAALAFWVVPEWYSTGEGRVSGCAHRSASGPRDRAGDERRMVEVSRGAGRDPDLARAFFHDEALTADIAKDGTVDFKIGPEGRWLVKGAGASVFIDSDTGAWLGVFRRIAHDRAQLLSALHVEGAPVGGERANELMRTRAREAREALEALNGQCARLARAVERAERADPDRRSADLFAGETAFAGAVRAVDEHAYLRGAAPRAEWFVEMRDRLDALHPGGRGE